MATPLSIPSTPKCVRFCTVLNCSLSVSHFYQLLWDFLGVAFTIILFPTSRLLVSCYLCHGRHEGLG